MPRRLFAALLCVSSLTATIGAEPGALHARLTAAASAGNGAAAVMAARLVLWGQLEGEPQAALAALEDYARDGLPGAASALASAYYTGVGGAPDPAQARDWWRAAAAAGDHTAAYNLGASLLASGEDQPAALAALRDAARARHALACFLLGTWEAGHGAPAAARAALLCAAEQGYAPAQFNLATLAARSGEIELARQWYAAAAASFAPAAQALAALPAAPAAPPSTAAETVAAAPAPDLPPAAVHDLAWVLAQPPDHFTLQVAAGSSLASLTKLIARHADGAAAAVFLHRPGAREPYSAVLGSFPDQAAASERLARLPAALARNTPLLRRYARLQRELSELGADAR